jgi:hypothetical protein
MNHPFFYFSIAALGLFYGVLFQSALRDEFRDQDTGDSGGNSNTPTPPTKRPPSILSVFLAHWISPADYTPAPLKISKGLPGPPSLSVN